MNGSLRQRSPGSWELAVELGKDALGKRRRKYVTVQGNKTEARRKLLTAVDRGIMLDVGTSKVLREHRAAQERLIATMGDSYADRERMFTKPTGEWLNPTQLIRAIKRLGERVGESNMTIRSLRHFHASVALQTGQNIVVVSKRLGHSNVSITSDIYAHSLPGWQRQAADAFAAAMEEDTKDNGRIRAIGG